jgi:ankyrin repeat protein
MPRDTELHKLCGKNDYDGVVALLRPSEKELDVNEPGSGGRTPLHRAIGANADDIVKLLIEKHNADFTKADSTGRTAIHFSVIANNTEILLYIMNKLNKKDINQITGKKSSALHLAVNQSSYACLDILLNKFDSDDNRLIDTEMKNNDNLTAYEIAQAKKDSTAIGIFRKTRAAATKSGACILL